jgi:hypothetical protein
MSLFVALAAFLSEKYFLFFGGGPTHTLKKPIGHLPRPTLAPRQLKTQDTGPPQKNVLLRKNGVDVFLVFFRPFRPGDVRGR